MRIDIRSLPKSQWSVPCLARTVLTPHRAVAPSMLASPALALQLAAPNAVGTMVGFGISYAVASVAFGGGRAKGAAPSARETLGGMARENVPRVRTLSVALAAVAALVISGAGANMVMPTFAQQAVYSVWFAMMALVDELHDTMPTLSPGRSDPPGPLVALCWALLLLPIPYLLMVQDVYKLFALQFVVSQTLSAKLDLPEFKAAVALGVPVVAFLAVKSGVVLSGPSAVGMALLSLGHVIYETHDENPLLIRLREKLSWLPAPAWLIFNQHFNMVLLVLCGLLPTQWLCCVTAAYPVAKIGVACGALRQLEGAEAPLSGS